MGMRKTKVQLIELEKGGDEEAGRKTEPER